MKHILNDKTNAQSRARGRESPGKSFEKRRNEQVSVKAQESTVQNAGASCIEHPQNPHEDIEHAYAYEEYYAQNVEDIFKETDLSIDSIVNARFSID
ncbi:uncharacterized protein NEMAJ01_2221 [Nematocida major]|uniref:uncharacterized protein n=1 Tax=Nematocida major TaxID=1912982 RepID=UPI0020077227|nr:uncharacterized protein NEMAJ01_2221 [Nematocida major]KAH9387325.1 hypothetical protein NEMAJ01_2221 [Nematocida major]